ncbi:MAG TPA: hypothetical protein VLL52_08885 [Anaerolineae bacterium]|nr:hypothetical protein [Anaerolineae bacterium]
MLFPILHPPNPPPNSDLTITNNTDSTLTWLNDPNHCTYDLDPSTIGDPNTNYYYQITSTNCTTNGTTTSNQVGEFDYTIIPSN